MTAEDLENLSSIDSIAAHCPIMILSDRSGSMSGVDSIKSTLIWLNCGMHSRKKVMRRADNCFLPF